MTMKVAYCAGHGLNTPGKRTPDDEREWSFNDKIACAFHAELLKYEDVELKRFDDVSGKTDVPLRNRTSKANAWGANLYISFHHNANTGTWGSWTGIETYPGSSATSKAYGEVIHDAMVKAYGLRDRGVKSKNLHITRETKMPSVLIEGGYMDSTVDIVKLRDNKVLENAGRLVARAVAEQAKLKLKHVKTVEKIVSEPVKAAPKDLPAKDVFYAAKITDGKYGVYHEPKNNYKYDANKYIGWILAAIKEQTVKGEEWVLLTNGVKNEFGWISKSQIAELPMTYTELEEDTVAYTDGAMTKVFGTIVKGRIVIIEEFEDKYLILSGQRALYIKKKIKGE